MARRSEASRPDSAPLARVAPALRARDGLAVSVTLPFRDARMEAPRRLSSRREGEVVSGPVREMS
jgi:hypothetical protein